MRFIYPLKIPFSPPENAVSIWMKCQNHLKIHLNPYPCGCITPRARHSESKPERVDSWFGNGRVQLQKKRKEKRKKKSWMFEGLSNSADKVPSRIAGASNAEQRLNKRLLKSTHADLVRYNAALHHGTSLCRNRHTFPPLSAAFIHHQRPTVSCLFTSVCHRLLQVCLSPLRSPHDNWIPAH